MDTNEGHDVTAKLDEAAASLEVAATSLRDRRRSGRETQKALEDAAVRIEAARRLLAQLGSREAGQH